MSAEDGKTTQAMFEALRAEMKSGLVKIENQIAVLYDDIIKVRANQREMLERIEELSNEKELLRRIEELEAKASLAG